jgi:hypothetical protein
MLCVVLVTTPVASSVNEPNITIISSRRSARSYASLPVQIARCN